MTAEHFAADEAFTEYQLNCIIEVLDDEALKKRSSLIFQGKEDEATSESAGPLTGRMLGSH